VDRDQLRRVAATRAGYATYPDTRPGSPYWQRTRQPGPCTWADRPGAGLVCVRADHRHHGQAVAATTPAPVTAVALAEHLTAAMAETPPRRRWWHRLAPWRADR
jgi:hypothetical protein